MFENNSPKETDVRIKTNKTKQFSIWLMAMAVFSPAMAYQPSIADAHVTELKKRGHSKDVMGKILLQNKTKKTLLFKYAPLKNQSYKFKISPSSVYLRPGQKAPVKFRGSLNQQMRHQVMLNFDVLSERKLKVGNFRKDLYFSVKQGTYTLSSYKKLFLQRNVRDEVMGSSFSTGKVRANMPISRDYRRKMPKLKQLISLNRELIYKIPTNSGVKRRQVDRPIYDRPIIVRPIPRPFPITPLLDFGYGGDEKSSNTTAVGKFSFKGMDNLLHPAFGWRVRAWRKRSGNWKKVAEDWVESDGKWRLVFTKKSGKMKFQYVAFNRFFKPLDPNNDTYRWVGPQHNSVGTNHSEGHWFADASAGNARGLGEIYDEGMVLWSKLYHRGGINPLRGSAIKVYFPNTNYDCGSGTGTPWSCASTSGKIWLIPTHASRFGVMTHELGHQINYQFWNNQRPPNSGGSHSLGSCYTPGLAMMEGYANFMVFWAHANRGTDPNAGFDFRVEDPSFACSTNNKNESWVAAAFWDLHDTRADGNDVLWFNHEGAVPKIYLTNGKKNSMSAFKNLYRNAASNGHETHIDNIFSQNNITP
jgi:hypothetical protein